MNNELNIVQSIKLSFKKTFVIYSNLELDDFEKKK